MSSTDPAIDTLQQIIKANSTLTNLQLTCSEFAQNITLLQINGTNLFNACTTYPNISRDLDANTLTPQFTTDLAQRGVSGGQVALSQAITDTVVGYLASTCGNINCDEQNSQAQCVRQNLLVDNSTLSADGLASCQGSICNRLVGLLMDNPDIGGIGVYISYAAQIVMAILIASYVIFTFIRANRRSEPIRTSGAFVDACVNFHRTQCWFISTLVVAAFISLGGGTVSIVDLYLLLTVALNGVALLSFTLMVIMYFGKRSWYTLMLTLVGYTLCTVFFFLALTQRESNQYKIAPPWLLCWYDVRQIKNSLAVLNFVTTTAALPMWFFALSYAYSTAVLVGCVLVQIFQKSLVGRFSHKNRAVPAILATVLGVGYLPVLVLQVYLLKLFFKLVDGHAWGFGQVIAATVWIPLIIDYVHDRFFQLKQEKMDQMAEKNNDEAAQSLVRPAYDSMPNTPGFDVDVDARSQRTSYAGTSQKYESYRRDSP